MIKGLVSLWERTSFLGGSGNQPPTATTTTTAPAAENDSEIFVQRLRRLLEGEEKEGGKQRKQLHEMARRGFPPAVRAEAWLEVLQVRMIPSTRHSISFN